MQKFFVKGFIGCSVLLTYKYFNNETVKPWDYNWDFMNSSKHEKESKNYCKNDCHHIILIRHGQYNMDKKSEKKLTELGKIQAILTGKKLKQMNISFDRVYTSTMVRAKETTDLIISELGDYSVNQDVLLEEGPPCQPQPSRYNEISRSLFVNSVRIEAAFRKFIHRLRLRTISASNSESLDQDSYTLIVCHANVIRYFICRALQFPSDGWLRFSLDHGSITELSIYSDGRVVLDRLGDASHMPVCCITRR